MTTPASPASAHPGPCEYRNVLGWSGVGPDHQARGLSHGRAAAGAPPYPGDPVTGGRHLGHPEVLADLRPGLARRLDQDRIEQGPPRAVQGVHALVGGKPPVHDQAVGVETHPAGRRRARRRQHAQQAPPLQQRHARDLELMGGDGVTGKPDPVHRQHPQPCRASSIAVAAPAIRAPTTITSYRPAPIAASFRPASIRKRMEAPYGTVQS